MTSDRTQSQNDDPQIDFDLDALQAQINMAMAETEELVSSWVQPSKAKNTGTTSGNYRKPKRTFEEMERELKEYLRRPPRLGVGAPIPEPTGPTAQEELKLKNKLVGKNNKKRPGDATRTTAPEKEVEDDEDEDEEETKVKKGESGSSMKRARIDPFGLPKKKAKRTDGETNVTLSVNTNGINRVSDADRVPRATLARDALTKNETKSTSPLNSQGAQFGTGSPTSPISSTSPASPTSTKKKKKKKLKITSPHIDVNPNGVLNSSTISGIASSHNTSALPGGISSASTTNGAGLVFNASSVQQISNANHTSPTASVTSLTSPTSPSSLTSTKKKKKKKKKKHALTQPDINGIPNGFPVPSRTQSGGTSSAQTDNKSPTIGTPNVNGTTVEEEEGEAEVEEWTGFGDATPDSVDGQEADIPSPLKPKANGIPITEPRSPTTNKAQSLPQLSLPLLNLNGPPPPPPHPITNVNHDGDENDTMQSPKTKKRRRRRKKKSKVHGNENETGMENTG